MNKTTIATAVALALGSATAAHAQSSCANPDFALYIAGSSAAVPAFKTALQADLFTAGQQNFSSTNGDFEAFCGTVSAAGAAATSLTQGSIATIYYRAEGGSVVGALPVVSGKAIKFLDLTGPGCLTTNPPTTGTSAGNGTADSWSGCVTSHGVEMGVTDLEPSVFYSNPGTKVSNYPTDYSAAAFGTASQSQLISLASGSVRLFQQVFGIFVNTNGLNGGGVGQPINLSRETVANILTPGHYTDWSKVPSASGGQVSNTSATINLKNREAGSGTRTGASIYFLGQECTSAGLALKDPGGSTNDSFATGDVIKAAASTAGAITYASIDNISKSTNLVLASISGVAPTNLAAAAGQYDYWFEATAVKGNTSGNTGGITTPGGTSLYNWLTTGELTELATAPNAPDILAIPGLGRTGHTNVATVPLTSNGSGATTIYINPFTRSGSSCNIPAEQN